MSSSVLRRWNRLKLARPGRAPAPNRASAGDAPKQGLILRKVVPAAFRRYLNKEQKGQLDLEGEDQRLSWRGVWVGAFLSFFLAVAAPYGNMIIRGTYMSLDFSTPGAIFLFLVLIGPLNVAFKLGGRG